MSRKEKFSRRKIHINWFRLKKIWDGAMLGFWISASAFGLSISFSKGIMVFILGSVLSIFIPKRNTLLTFLFHFWLYPAAISLWLLYLLSFFQHVLPLRSPDYFWLAVLIFIPSVYSFLYLLKHKGKKPLLERARQATRILQAIAVTATGLAGIYAFLELDFSFLNNVSNNLISKGYQSR
jgi:hypothetical protein